MLAIPCSSASPQALKRTRPWTRSNILQHPLQRRQYPRSKRATSLLYTLEDRTPKLSLSAEQTKKPVALVLQTNFIVYATTVHAQATIIEDYKNDNYIIDDYYRFY